MCTLTRNICSPVILVSNDKDKIDTEKVGQIFQIMEASLQKKTPQLLLH